jgi:hypothetical protein
VVNMARGATQGRGVDGLEWQDQDPELMAIGEAIIAGAADLAAAMARWLALVAEFDRREGWRVSGCHSVAHWLSWKCGISPVTGRQHARVARALTELPLVAAAFAAGELSYSKVRALVRFVTPDTEADMVDLARVTTGAHLDRIAQGYATATGDPAAGRRRQRLRWSWDDDGDIVISAKLPPEVGRDFLRAMGAAASELAPDPSGDPAGSRHGEAPADGPQSSDVTVERPTQLAEVFGAMVQLALAGAANGASPPPPELVLTVAVADLSAEPGSAPAPPATPASAPRRRSRYRLRAPRPRVKQDLARRLSCDASTATLLHDSRGTPLDLGRRQRTVNHALKVALQLRDGGCRFPGCDHTRFTHAHHVVHWADGGPTELSNLITLCTFHHRLLHEGGYTIRTRADGTHRFVRPNGALMTDGVTTRCGPVGSIPAASGSISPTWGGEHLDLGHAIDALLQAERIAEHRRHRGAGGGGGGA